MVELRDQIEICKLLGEYYECTGKAHFWEDPNDVSLYNTLRRIEQLANKGTLITIGRNGGPIEHFLNLCFCMNVGPQWVYEHNGNLCMCIR